MMTKIDAERKICDSVLLRTKSPNVVMSSCRRP